MSRPRDNWEKLVSAVVKKEQLRQLCYQDSFSTIASDFSQQILDLEDVSVAQPPPIPLENSSSVSQVSNSASGRRITRRLLSPWYRIRKSKDDHLVKVLSENQGIQLGRLRRFSIQELLVATDNFSYKNPSERDGSFNVYKGWLTDGSPVTVKRYRDREAHAESRFQKELKINSIVVHPNVVCVLGFCITPKELLIVSPSIVNGSVASWLRDRNGLQPPLDWPIRKGIALGAARGLAYLHYECDKKIMHHDIKAANIWLDDDFEAVITGLDLATITDLDVILEYICSDKTDVFDYGVFLLELITGQRAFDLDQLANDDGVMLLKWVKINFKEEKWEKIVDPDCEVNNMEGVVEQLIKIALLCTQTTLKRRPNMLEIVVMLEIGDLLAKRWEEICNEEMEKTADSWLVINSDAEISTDGAEISTDGELSPR